MSIMSLRKFIWSFTRLGDLKSAYETLQHMVALAVRGRLFIRTNVEGKLCSSRLDIPIPSNGEVTLKEDSVVLKIDSHVEQCTVSSTQNGEIENARMCLLNKYKGMPMMKVLRWSFSDVIHACAQAQNGGLAEELMQQVFLSSSLKWRRLFFLIILLTYPKIFVFFFPDAKYWVATIKPYL